MQKNEVGTLLHTKTNSKWVKDLNGKAKTHRRNIGVNLHYLEFSNAFLAITPKDK